MSSPESPDGLDVATGWLDDRRRTLTRASPLFGAALYASRWQSGWDPDQHRDFWAGFLPLWPSVPGPRQMTDRLGQVARYLWVEGHLTHREISQVLGYAPDTARREHWVDRGHMIEAESPRDAADGSAKDIQMGKAPPLPWVYVHGENPPAYGDPAIPEPAGRAAEYDALLSKARSYVAGMRAAGRVRDVGGGTERVDPPPGSPTGREIMDRVLFEIGITDPRERTEVIAHAWHE